MGEEKQAIAASLGCAAIGIAILFLLNNLVQPEEKSISEIIEQDIGKFVQIKGRVSWVLQRESFVLFTLENRAKIKVIKFNPSKEEREAIVKNSFVEVIGKVQLYENGLEIAASEIRRF